MLLAVRLHVVERRCKVDLAVGLHHAHSRRRPGVGDVDVVPPIVVVQADAVALATPVGEGGLMVYILRFRILAGLGLRGFLEGGQGRSETQRESDGRGAWQGLCGAFRV
jgi:hypothetical protein